MGKYGKHEPKFLGSRRNYYGRSQLSKSKRYKGIASRYKLNAPRRRWIKSNRKRAKKEQWFGGNKKFYW